MDVLFGIYLVVRSLIYFLHPILFDLGRAMMMMTVGRWWMTFGFVLTVTENDDDMFYRRFSRTLEAL